MGENLDKTASSMAVVEKRPHHHRAGGCVGIFFQLFDWNRRFANKKLFSKKLLPPAHPKQGNCKFGGDGKLPKHRLIANENSGGFPNTKKNGSFDNDSKQKPQTRSPSLVARLMGLESMPALQKNKTKEVSDFQTESDERDKFTSAENGFDLSLEKGNKHELRPQKLQKTGISERQAMTRFTAEALQFKNVVSRSKKHHRPKFVNPVKSPRMSSGRTSSRLIDAATRILEPGLQSTNRAKNALTYSSTIHSTFERDFLIEQKPKSSHFYEPTDSIPKPESCKHCGSHIDLVDLPSNSEEKYVNSIVEESKKDSTGPDMSSFEQENWRVSERYNKELSSPFTAQERNNLRKQISGENQDELNSKNQRRKSQRCPQSSSNGLKHRSQRQNQAYSISDRVPQHRSNLHYVQTTRAFASSNVNNQVKGFVGLNQGLRSRTITRVPERIGNIVCGEEIGSCNRRGSSSSSPMRKRRPVNANDNGESYDFHTPTLVRQKNARCKTVDDDKGKIDRCKDKYKIVDDKGRDVIAFKFGSHKAESSITGNKTREFSGITDNSVAKDNAEKLLALSGDELGALLQQKLKELTSQEEEDEFVADGSEPKRTTAVILQELISALASEKPMVSSSSLPLESEKFPCRGPHLSKKRIIEEGKKRTVTTSLSYLHDDEHLSPGSVLEASFSNDSHSCLSSSFGDGSETNLVAESVNFCCDEPPNELFDSAGSSNKRIGSIELLINNVSQVSEVLYRLSLASSKLKRIKLAFAKEVILNAELVLKSVASRNSSENRSFSLSNILVRELENLASVLWEDFASLLGLDGKKSENLLKEFVLDCVIEYLYERYGQHLECGYKAWSRIPLCKSADKLLTEIVKEVSEWTSLVEKGLDEIIEDEMSQSCKKWSKFESEEYETGAEICKDMLQILVDETVVEMLSDVPKEYDS